MQHRRDRCADADTEYCPGNPYHALRFCFDDELSAKWIYPHLFDAITMWAPALEIESSVFITPDPACGGEWRCMCNTTGVKPDSLIITLGDVSNAPAGYSYNKPNPEHILYLKVETRPPATDVEAFNWWKGWMAQTFAHELGHALGLLVGGIDSIRACITFADALHSSMSIKDQVR